MLALKGYGTNTSMMTGDRPLRGQVNGYSSKSVRRCKLATFSVNWKALGPFVEPLMITLTVHKDEGPRHAKLALERLRKRVVRAFGDVPEFWKLEPQRRGAPHFHLIVAIDGTRLPMEWGYGVSSVWVQWLQEWYLTAWRDVTGQDGTDFDDEGKQICITEVRVEQPRSVDGCMKYVAQYVGKPAATPEAWIGHRFWGERGTWPRRTEVHRVGRSESWTLRRWARSFVRACWRQAKVRAAAKGKAFRKRIPRAYRDPWGSFAILVKPETARAWLSSLRAASYGEHEGFQLL